MYSAEADSLAANSAVRFADQAPPFVPETVPAPAGADVTATVSYSLTDSAGGLFAINPATGVVTVAGALDAETATSHNITVLATSTDGSTSTATSGPTSRSATSNRS